MPAKESGSKPSARRPPSSMGRSRPSRAPMIWCSSQRTRATFVGSKGFGLRVGP